MKTDINNSPQIGNNSIISTDQCGQIGILEENVAKGVNNILDSGGIKSNSDVVIFNFLSELEGLRIVDFEGLPNGIEYKNGKFIIINEIRILQNNNIDSYEGHPRLKTANIKFFVHDCSFDGYEGELTLNYLDYRKYDGRYI